MDCKEIFSFENLWQAHKRCRLGKQHKRGTIMFELEMGANIGKLAKMLQCHKYKLGRYKQFKVFDPKERQIEALPYRDRVVLMCFCKNVLEPRLERRLIYDNADSRGGKGTDFAIRRLHEFMHKIYINEKEKTGYYLKCDIRKYFQSINHDILLRQLADMGFSPDEMWFMELVVKSHAKKGIPLGNQTSQWFGVLYLNDLDRMIKEKLKVAYYIRYMDDFVLLDTDKLFLQHCRNEIEKYCVEKLELTLNNKTQIGKLKNGIDFLGFNHKLQANGRISVKLRSSAKKRQIGYLKAINHYYQLGVLNDDYLKVRENAYKAHMKRTNQFKFIRNAFNHMRKVFRQKACKLMRSNV